MYNLVQFQILSNGHYCFTVEIYLNNLLVEETGEVIATRSLPEPVLERTHSQPYSQLGFAHPSQSVPALQEKFPFSIFREE